MTTIEQAARHLATANAETARDFVTRHLHNADELERLRALMFEDLEARGFTLVDGGLTYEDEDRAAWVVTDYRTGRTLAAGDGGVDALDGAFQDDWYHVDLVYSDALDAVKEPDTLGLPGWMADHFQDLIAADQGAARRFANEGVSRGIEA